nr:uncharacterized protein LOC123494393 [Aegilops tauschii subsp. strangulata]
MVMFCSQLLALILMIVMAIVKVECTDSWLWFLNTPKTDLGIGNSIQYTIMSDRQMGLINAVRSVFPEAEHRFCVRHLYQNFRKLYPGETLKELVWACAKSCNEPLFERNMEKMKVACPAGYEWLKNLPKECWVKAYFREFPKCDLVLNNTCEVFNSYILDARDMPILTMFEKIRCQLMNRIYTKMKEAINKWTGMMCPKISKKLQKLVDFAKSCTAYPSGSKVFQVTGHDHTYRVELGTCTCTCRRWQLTGIPCSHGVAAARRERIKPETMVDDCYNLKFYVKAYGHSICPVRDKKFWKKTVTSLFMHQQ